jgi:uncharacterized protein YdaU (DUF1376 family)
MSLPSMMFYPGDYLRDTGHLSTEEHGAYLLLLWHAWTQGGVLPLDDDMLRRITRLAPKAWAKSRAVIVAFFTRQEDGYHQKRLDRELAKARAMVARNQDERDASAERMRKWRSRHNGSDHPPRDAPVTRNVRITGAQQNAQRDHNRTRDVTDVPQSQPVPTNQREVKSNIYINPLSSKDLVGSRARENEPDSVETLHRIERRDDEKLSDNPAIAAHIRRAAKACAMRTDDYGTVRSRSVQIDAVLHNQEQPEVVDGGEVIPPHAPLRPCEPIRSVEEQLALLHAAMAKDRRAA